MVYVNGIDIPSFPEETSDEFRNRVAVTFDTLPNLMSVIKDDNVYFMEKLIKETRLSSFTEFFKWVSKTYDFPVLNVKTVIELWIYYRKEGQEQEFLEFDALNKELKLELDFLKIPSLRQFNPNEFNKNRKAFDKDFKLQKEELKKNVQKNDKIYVVIESTKEQNYTDFKKQRYQVYFLTTLKDLSLDYIFSTIVCNPVIPFCTFKQICKLYKKQQHDFSQESFNDRILIKINIKNDVFVDSFLFIEAGLLKVEISIDSAYPFEFKEHIKNLFDIPVEFGKDFNEHDIYGVVLFPQQQVNKYLFSDLIMNYPIVSKFLCVDESVKASTKKSGLLVKYKGGDLKGVNIDASCNLICKRVVENDSELKGLDRKLFPIGSYYIRARISKFKDMKKIDTFISLISKFLTIYHTHENAILDAYKAFLGKSFKLDDEGLDEQEEETIETLVPSLFVSKYRKACVEERHPVILNESEKDAFQEYKDYIRFPKEASPEQYCYRCKSKEYPFIGLMPNNTLSNRDLFEYIPCCYSSRKNNNNNIDVYYFDKEKETEKKQQGIISTVHHLLDRDHYGELPTNIDTLLTTLYKDDIYLFYRMGVSKSKHSFLECVLKATFEKKRPVKSYEIASQENPDLTLEEMKEMFTDETIYMNPRRWIRLLEHIYQCHIKVFSRMYKNENAELVVPYHKGPYLQYKTEYDRTLYILENQDSRTLEIRCELIAMKENDTYLYLFDSNVSISPTQFYLGDKKIIIKHRPYPPSTITYKCQILDSFKKTQCLVTTNDVYLLCDPIPPLDLPIDEKTTVFESKLENVEALIGKIDQTTGTISFGMFTIHLKKNHKEKKDLSTFEMNKKIAKILGEFFIYMFSIYLQTPSKLSMIHKIKLFVDEHVTICKTSFKLISSSIIDMDIMEKSGYFIDGKIMVTSQDLLQRLVCLLCLRINNNLNEVKAYYMQQEFSHFYESIADYTPSVNILIHSSDLQKLDPVTFIVYNEFQRKEKYYLQFEKKIFSVEKVDDNTDTDMYPVVYDENLSILREDDKTQKEPIRLIKYTEKMFDENKRRIIRVKYQLMKLV